MSFLQLSILLANTQNNTKFMDNFKEFQLTAEEAMNITGEGKGKGRGRKFMSTLTTEDRTAIRTSLSNLRDTEGWADLTREERRAGIVAIFEPYKG